MPRARILAPRASFDGGGDGGQQQTEQHEAVGEIRLAWPNMRSEVSGALSRLRGPIRLPEVTTTLSGHFQGGCGMLQIS